MGANAAAPKPREVMHLNTRSDAGGAARTALHLGLLAGGGALVAAALADGAAFGWQAVLLFWVGPQLLGQPLLRLYLPTKHTGRTEDANGLVNARTMLTAAPVRLLVWNMPFHAEHHLYTLIPFHRLRDAHVLLRGRLGQVGTGYARWHRDQIRALRGAGASR